MLNDAIVFATEAHAGQLHKGFGMPYNPYTLEISAIEFSTIEPVAVHARFGWVGDNGELCFKTPFGLDG